MERVIVDRIDAHVLCLDRNKLLAGGGSLQLWVRVELFLPFLFVARKDDSRWVRGRVSFLGRLCEILFQQISLAVRIEHKHATRVESFGVLDWISHRGIARANLGLKTAANRVDKIAGRDWIAVRKASVATQMKGEFGGVFVDLPLFGQRGDRFTCLRTVFVQAFVKSHADAC